MITIDDEFKKEVNEILKKTSGKWADEPCAYLNYMMEKKVPLKEMPELLSKKFNYKYTYHSVGSKIRNFK